MVRRVVNMFGDAEVEVESESFPKHAKTTTEPASLLGTESEAIAAGLVGLPFTSNSSTQARYPRSLDIKGCIDIATLLLSGLSRMCSPLFRAQLHNCIKGHDGA